MPADDFRRRIIGRERDPNDPEAAEKIAEVGNFLHLECGHRVLSFDLAEQIEGEVLCAECIERDKRKKQGD
jgi:hypothetical protein